MATTCPECMGARIKYGGYSRCGQCGGRGRSGSDARMACSGCGGSGHLNTRETSSCTRCGGAGSIPDAPRRPSPPSPPIQRPPTKGHAGAPARSRSSTGQSQGIDGIIALAGAGGGAFAGASAAPDNGWVMLIGALICGGLAWQFKGPIKVIIAVAIIGWIVISIASSNG